MEKIFDIAKDSEKSWGVIAQGIDKNFEELGKQVGELDSVIDLENTEINISTNYGDVVASNGAIYTTRKFSLLTETFVPSPSWKMRFSTPDINTTINVYGILNEHIAKVPSVYTKVYSPSSDVEIDFEHIELVDDVIGYKVEIRAASTYVFEEMINVKAVCRQTLTQYVKDEIKNLSPSRDIHSETLCRFGYNPFANPLDTDYSHIFVFGQSFALGGSSKAYSKTSIEGNYMIASKNTSKYVVDEDHPQMYPLKANGIYEEPIVNICNALQKLYTQRRLYPNFIASTAGSGGKSLEELFNGGNSGGWYNPNVITAMTTAKGQVDALGKTSSCCAMVFLQGESDYRLDITKDEYKEQLLALKNRFQTDAVSIYEQDRKPMFFIYQTSGNWLTQSSAGRDCFDEKISMAQMEFAEENEDVILVTPCYAFTTFSDNHLASNGYMWFGEHVAKAMIQVYEHNIGYQNLSVSDVSVDKKNNEICLSFTIPCPPLRIDTWTLPSIKNYGFDAKGDGDLLTITDVIVLNNGVVLKIAEDMSTMSEIEVAYAGYNTNGRGNICDSDAWISTEKYHDDSTETSQSSDNETDSNETGVPITQRPTSKDGSSIFGRNYPMQNFLGNFYRKITF